jgi:hypothetical protein
MVKKTIAKAVTRSAGKKLTKKKRPETAEQKSKRLIKLDSDIKKVKALRKKELERIRAEKAAVKKKASTQRGMVGSGSRSVPKGAKGPKKKEAEPMRAMSDAATARDAVSKGQGGRITTGKSFNLESMRTASQRKRAQEFARIDTKNAKDRTADEKKFFKQYRLKEIDRSMRAASSASKTQRAKRKNPKLELPLLKGEKKTVRTKDDMGDPSTGEITSKTTANRAAALARSADRKAEIDRMDRRTKRSRKRNVREMKRKK